MASLYDIGWRQGSLFSAPLPLDLLVLGADEQPTRAHTMHPRWVVATQDCDLAATSETSAGSDVELRPVFSDGSRPDWGIRSARYFLTDTEYAEARSPRVTIAAVALVAVAVPDVVAVTSPERRRGWTTWLGLRYDRPAVPTALLPLAKRIAEGVARRDFRPFGMRVRDVLMQFDTSQVPTRFSLFAVLDKAEDRDSAREWLAGIGTRVPAEMGLLDELEARDATGISLHVVETSYAADVTQLTWPRGAPDPLGAE